MTIEASKYNAYAVLMPPAASVSVTKYVAYAVIIQVAAAATVSTKFRPVIIT